jgi:lysophospholipase L1-like esterase
MRLRLTSLLLVFTCVFAILQATDASVAIAELPLVDGDRVLFIGDSITQDGRYVDLIQGYLWAKYPDREITIVNAGLSSETVSGITEPVHPYPRPNINDRLDRALALAQPDWVFVCYGMNDGIYHPIEERITTAYRNGLQQVIEAIGKTDAKIVLLTPPVFDAQAPGIADRIAETSADEPYGYRNPFKDYDQTLEALGGIVTEWSADRRVHSVIDIHAATHHFLEAAKRADPSFVYGDGVHPPLEGHTAMAGRILVGMGEPEAEVDRVLALIAGIRPPGSNASELPTGGSATKIRESLFELGRTLSAQIRQTVDPKKGPEVVEPFSNATFKTHAETIKKMIAE